MSADRGARDVRIRPSRPSDLPGIEAIMALSLVGDAIPGYTQHDLDRTIARIPADHAGTLVAVIGEGGDGTGPATAEPAAEPTEAGVVLGYVTPRHDDLTVHPDHRRRGVGRALVDAAVDLVRERGEPQLELYVPQAAGPTRFAEAVGLRYGWSLWLFALDAGRDLPPPEFPPEVATLGWHDMTDLERYVDLANLAFEGHPTPINLTVEHAGFVAGLAEFDADGIVVLAERADPDRYVGFAKCELTGPAEPGVAGYVGQIGVVPAWRGRGLGRQLLRWSVAYLRGRGAGRVELTVEARNETATRLYRAEGFEPAVEWPHWIRPA